MLAAGVVLRLVECSLLGLHGTCESAMKAACAADRSAANEAWNRKPSRGGQDRRDGRVGGTDWRSGCSPTKDPLPHGGADEHDHERPFTRRSRTPLVMIGVAQPVRNASST